MHRFSIGWQSEEIMSDSHQVPMALPRRQIAEWVLLAAVLLCGALMSAWFAWSEQRLAENTETARLATQTRIVDDSLRRQMGALRNALGSVRDAVTEPPFGCWPNCGGLALTALNGASPAVRAFLVVDRNGKVLAGDDPFYAQHAGDPGLAQDLKRMHDPSRIYLSQPKETTPGMFDIRASMLLPTPSGGAVVAILNPDYFNALMRAVLYAPDMRGAITEEGGQPILSVPGVARSGSAGTAPADFFFRRHINGGSLLTVMEGRSTVSHDQRLVVQRSVLPESTGLDQTLVVKVSRGLDQLLGPTRYLAYMFGLAWLLVALGSVAALLHVQRRRRAVQDWSARHHAERAADAARVEMALDGAGLGLWELKLASHRKSLDPRGAAMIGYTSEQVTNVDCMHDVHPEDRAMVKQSLDRYLNGKDPAFEAEYRQRHANGSWIWIQSRGKLVERDIEGRPLRMVGTRQDISARKHAESDVEHLAFHDSLTGLPNRRLLHDRLRQALVKGERGRRVGAVLFVDLDNFKSFNDTLGHDIGDHLLRLVASRLRQVTREADTVARLGGDEFVILLENLDDVGRRAQQHAELVAGKMLRALSAAYYLEGHEIHCTPSIGIALYGEEQFETMDELLKQADMAMYDAKASGRNTFRFFSPRMQAGVDEQAALENDLRCALQRDELRVQFQPIVDDAGHMISTEALVRWQHPTRGLVTPAQFIPIAERSGLILAIGEWVLAQACGRLAQWTRDAPGRNLQVAVNVSARQFGQPDFVDQVLRVLKQSGADPHRLKLELTESVLVNNVEEVIAKMASLKAHGVLFAIDDFGTGYSSLSYLRRLPLDQLKIDKSFVHDMLGSQSAITIVCAIVALADSLGMDVVAEGVETEAERQFVRDCGCRSYQGFLIGQPVAAEDLFRERLAGADVGHPVD
jgi:diguanylate cyclase (GGDEF)-like protein/PAS domain S-box-containing protein